MNVAAEESLVDIAEGFEGAVAGLTLHDVIQMNALNRFSGCISIQFGQRAGIIYFRDGEIIHSEQGEQVGETAFYEILQWPGGKFNLQPKITTTSHTIRESWKFLLMEACRLTDENRNRSNVMEEKQALSMATSAVSVSIPEKVAEIEGVSHAVLLGKDGTPIDDSSYQAENLAAQSVYLAMLGDQLGNIFGAGEVKAAAVQGKSSHLLMYEAKNHYLGVAVKGETSLGAVEAEIRRAFGPKR